MDVSQMRLVSDVGSGTGQNVRDVVPDWRRESCVVLLGKCHGVKINGICSDCTYYYP